MVKFLNIALIQLFIVLYVAIDLDATALNVIDKCWKANPNWRKNPTQLARCSVGFAGKMTGNMGSGVTVYTVTDPSDDPQKPKPGTLRYGATQGKKWIVFSKNMKITLLKTIHISAYTAIDGRGFSIQLTGGGLTVEKVTDVIIHGLEITGCKDPGDGISLITAKKVWIDHNTLSNSFDGLVDLTQGSTDVTVSNNWFKNQDKVMLLGNEDKYPKDKIMRVTVVLNRFGPDCNQRMPRLRHGYAHVVNNYYQGWVTYAIGGSASPRVMSEANYFIAAKNKKVTWPKISGNPQIWSVNDYFENGASFGDQKCDTKERPNYTKDQTFAVANAKAVKELTASAGVLVSSD